MKLGKRIFGFMFIFIAALSLVSCGNSNEQTPDVGSNERNKQMYEIYKLGVEANLVDVSYEDWLESINGTDAQEVMFQVSDGFLQWKREKETTWNNLFDLSSLVGEEEKPEDHTEGLVFTETYYNDEYAYIVSDYFGNDDSIIIPSYFKGLKVVGIGGLSFALGPNANLSSVYIPKEIKYIGNAAFSGAENLKTVIFEEGSQLKSIGYSAFESASSLENIVIPSSVTSISVNAFYGTTNLKTVRFEKESQITSIGKQAFSRARSLESIVLPEGITTIEEFAFSYTTNLTIYSLSSSKPEDWNESWNSSYADSTSPVYWLGEWHYDAEGNPTPNE